MNKPFIFVSCGQYADDEKRLGKQIVQMVKALTGFDAFFAEAVQDLNGLDSNILSALHDCSAFIVILHPRGTIERPGHSRLTRASVWIEQEIAVATYIHRIEKRALPIIAFKHVSVDREGLRDLLHLNPIEFTHESEVLAALPERLSSWATSLRPTGIRADLISTASRTQDGHAIRQLQLMLINDSNKRIDRFDGELFIPAALLKHWSAIYPHEVGRSDPRRFRFDEKSIGRTANPHDQVPMLSYEYCAACAAEAVGAPPDLKIKGTIWIDGREYSTEKTIFQLHYEANERAAFTAPRAAP